MKRIALALLACLVLGSPGHAAEYTRVLPEESRIDFRYRQMGVRMEGGFARFDGQLRFDPAAPADGSATITVDLASVDTGFADGNAEVGGTDWFDTAAFPRARFESTGVRALGGDRYEVAGRLTIKGRSQDVVVPARFSAEGERAVFTGSFTLRRGDFAVGEGAWRAFDIVANEVEVSFRIAAAR